MADPRSEVSFVGGVVLEQAFVRDDTGRFQEVGAGGVMETSSDEHGDDVQVGGHQDEVGDDAVVRVDPLSIVFAFDADGAAIVPALKKVGLFDRGAASVSFWRLDFPIATVGVFGFMEQEVTVETVARRSGVDGLQTLENDHFEGVADEITKGASAHAGV
jgi:hypothetical protein